MLYTITIAYFTTRQVELVRKKEFVAVAFDSDDEIFVVYLTFLACFNLGLEAHPF